MDLWEQVPECGVCRSLRCSVTTSIGRRRFARCLDCGVERLSERITEHRLDVLYASYYSASDPSPATLARELANPTFAHRRSRLEAFAGEGDRTLLELGCGDGNFLAVMRGAGWDVAGQEFSEETAALAGRRHAIHVCAGPLAPASIGRRFHVVAAYHVFEHIYHPAEWLGHVRQLVEPGGFVHLQVPNGGSLTRRLSGELWAGLVFPQHVYLYTPRALARTLRRSGFDVVSVTTWDPWHGPGCVAASASNVVHRVVSGRRPWTDRDPASARPRRENDAPARPATTTRRVLRAALERASGTAARVSAAFGCGDVVDVIATTTERHP